MTFTKEKEKEKNEDESLNKKKPKLITQIFKEEFFWIMTWFEPSSRVEDLKDLRDPI